MTKRKKHNKEEQKKKFIFQNQFLDETITFCSENIALVTAITSVLTLIITTLFQAGAYMYVRGQYEGWNIPINYITIDYKDIIYKFFGFLAIVVFWMVLSPVYVNYFMCAFKKEKFFSKIFHVLKALLIVPLCAIIYILADMLLNFSTNEVIYAIKNMSAMDVVYFVAICMVIYFSVFACGFGVKSVISFPMKKDSENINLTEQDKNEKDKTEQKVENEKSSFLKRMVVVIIFLLIHICIIYIIGTVYQSGKNSIMQKKTVEVVTIEDQLYVIAEQYKDNWILKKCNVSDNNLSINKDHYVIMDITDQNVVMRKLPNGLTLGECLVEDEVYSSDS